MCGDQPDGERGYQLHNCADMDDLPYSYRDDPSIPAFDDSAPIIIFDGMCVLCSTGVQWMLARDSAGHSRVAAIQDPIPQALYRHFGLNAETFDTFMVLADGVAYTKWAGVLAAGRTLPAPWRWLAHAGRAVPNAIGDPVYDWVQRKRLRWFGRRQTCLRPNAAESRRFLNPA
jgi:predicted DCC family thiol-disulfide oxidoreductase YuxK